MSTETFSNISVNVLNDTTTFPRVMLTINGNSVPVSATKVNAVNPNQKGIYVKCDNFYYFIPEIATIVLTNSKYSMSEVYPDTYETMTTIPDLLNTSNVTSMFGMFSGCTKLTTIPQLDTSNATGMDMMFYGCTSLPSIFPWIIDCSSISKANNMGSMFEGSSVTNVTLSNVSDSIKANITSQKLKGDDTLTINFV